MSPGSSEFPRASRKQRVLLLAILALSLTLDLVAIDWGLPVHKRDTWSFDEIPPVARGRTANERHGGRYPPLHYDLLRALYTPFRGFAPEGEPGDALGHRLRLAGRSLSVSMAVATVALVYCLAQQLLGNTGASLLAALIASLSVPLVRYAKTANLDVPYVFWFTLSLVFLARILERHRWVDYLLFAIAMACAIGTKDQAAGLYLAVPLLLVPSLRAHRERSDEERPSLVKTIFDPRLAVCLVLSLILFALIHRLFAAPGEFAYHLQVLTGKGSEGRADFAPTLSGYLAMTASAVRHLAFALGVPLSVASLGGVLLAIRDGRRRLLGLLLLCATYYVAFMVPVRYLRVRYFLPMAIVLSLFAALALWRWLHWQRLPLAVRVASTGLLLAYSLALPVCLVAQMVFDSRYRVEAWLADNVAPDETWRSIGEHPEFNVRGQAPIPLRRLQLNPHSYLRRIGAEYLVLSDVEAATDANSEIFAALESGAWDYEVAFRHHAEPCHGLLDWSHLSTNLSTVNPPITVFRKIPGDAEVAARIAALRPGEGPEEWAQVAELIARSQNLIYRLALDERTLAFGLHPDGWTRGALPAAILLSNPGDRRQRVWLMLHYSAPPGSPIQRVRVLTPETTHAVEIAAGDHTAVRLPPLAPGERRVVVVIAEHEWGFESDARNRGVRATVRYKDFRSDPRREVSPRRRASRRFRDTPASERD